MKSLQTGFLKNGRDADEVKLEAKTLIDEVEETEKKAAQLIAAYKNANNTLEAHVKNSKTVRSKSQELLGKANQLSASTTSKLKELEGND